MLTAEGKIKNMIYTEDSIYQRNFGFWGFGALKGLIFGVLGF